MSTPDFSESSRALAAGQVSRRKFMNRLLAGGMTASAAYAFMNATQGATVGAAAPLPTAALYGAPPGPPLSLTAAAGSRQVTLSWLLPAAPAEPPITDYVIQRSPNGSSWSTVNDGVRTARSHTVTGLTNGTRYFFRVLASNAEGNSTPSNVVSAIPRGVPAAPGSLRAVPGNRRVTLSWLLPAANGAPVTDYIIQRSPNGASWTTINDGVRTARSYTVTGLTNGTRYHFRVLARNAVGNSAPSNVASAIPRTVPSAVRSLVATPGASRQIRLTWLLPAVNGGAPITDYVIQRSPNGRSAWSTINDGVRTATSYTVTGLTNGTRYYFRVLARNAAGLGPASNVANQVPRTVPPAPVLRAQSRSGGALLTWTPPASTGGAAIARYVLQRSTNAATGWVNVSTTIRASARSYTASGLRNGTRYYFRLAAVNAAGRGPWGVTNVVPR